MRWLVFFAVIITIIAVIYYYHPGENPIDWFVSQKPGTTTSTLLNQPDQGGAHVPFADLTMAPDGSSPLQGSPANPPPAPKSPPPAPNVNPPPKQNISPVLPVQPRQPKSAKDKIFNMARDNAVTILAYDENPIGNVTMTCQADDKNNIYDFWDALLKFGIRDFDASKVGFNLQMDPNGRRIVTSTFKIRYIPEY